MAVQSGWWLLNADNAAVCDFLCLADQWQAFLRKITQAGAREVNREQERTGREWRLGEERERDEEIKRDRVRERVP